MQPILMIPKPKDESSTTPLTVMPDDAAQRALLVALRLASGLTQSEIARRMGLVSSSVGAVLGGRETKHPSLRWVARFAAACGGRVLVELPSVTSGAQTSTSRAV